MAEEADPCPDLEEGELDSQPPDVPAETSPDEASELRPVVPEPPPSPKVEEGWQLSSGSKKTKRKQIRTAHKAGQPVGADLYRAVYGAEARAEIIIRYHLQPIRVQDIQALVLWMLTDFSEINSPLWALVKNLPLIRQVVLIYLPGISSKCFEDRQELFPNLCKLGRPIKVAAKDGLVKPGYNSAILLNAPFAKHSKEKKNYMRQAAAGLEDIKAGGFPFPPAHYVLKPDMMAKLGYPLPERLKGEELLPPDGFVATRPCQTPGGPASKEQDVLLALDCEMCETHPQVYELTRVSLLDRRKQVLLDRLVLPYNAITDYHTDKSGITAEMLEGVTTRLEDVQQEIQKLVPAEAILVGHALENDLKALKVVHLRCIDTGALFPHPKGLPFRSALRRIAEKHLHVKIQIGSHDPIVDASTALDLALLKMKHGPAFGLTTQQVVGEPLAEVLMRAKQGCVLIDKSDTLSRFLSGCADGISCGSDAEVAAKLAREVQKERSPGVRAKFVWAQFRGLSSFLEQRADEQRKAIVAEQARAAVGGGESQGGVIAPGMAACTLASQLQKQLNGQPSLESPAAKQDQDSSRKHSLSSGAAEEPSAKRHHPEGASDVSGAKPVSEHEETAVSAGENGRSGSAPAAAEMEDGEAESSAEEAVLRKMDKYVGAAFEALPPDSVLIVATCQGDTASTRLQHEFKIRRARGLMQPPWTPKEELRFQKEVFEVSQLGLCFVVAK